MMVGATAAKKIKNKVINKKKIKQNVSRKHLNKKEKIYKNERKLRKK